MAAGVSRRGTPTPFLAALHKVTPAALPRPDVMMVRVGLLVRSDALDDADRLFTLLNVPPVGRWGMSPYSGYATAASWQDITAKTMLDGHPACNQHQAAFRVAYELPAVQRIAVGTDNPTHLRELTEAAAFPVDHAKVATYRTLLRDAARRTASQRQEVG